MNSVIKLSIPQRREFWEIPVLFEDAHLLALDKPAGLQSCPDRHHPDQPNLIQLLHEGIAAGKSWARERALDYLNHVHRPDIETSGIFLLAKSRESYQTLADLFGSDKPVRRHVALVHGSPRDSRLTINAKIGDDPNVPGKMRVDPQDGKRAQTRVEVRERFLRQTLLQCDALTDRPHQIRVHLWNSGLRVVGDELYGGDPLWLSRLKAEYRLKPGRVERPLISRPALHAEEFSFTHPVTGEPVSIVAPWPKDLRVAVKYLRQYASGLSNAGEEAV